MYRERERRRLAIVPAASVWEARTALADYTVACGRACVCARVRCTERTDADVRLRVQGDCAVEVRLRDLRDKRWAML
jgi:hypothetical protein